MVPLLEGMIGLPVPVGLDDLVWLLVTVTVVTEPPGRVDVMVSQSQGVLPGWPGEPGWPGWPGWPG